MGLCERAAEAEPQTGGKAGVFVGARCGCGMGSGTGPSSGASFFCCLGACITVLVWFLFEQSFLVCGLVLWFDPFFIVLLFAVLGAKAYAGSEAFGLKKGSAESPAQQELL